MIVQAYQLFLAFLAIAMFYTNIPHYLYERLGITFVEAHKGYVLFYGALTVPLLLTHTRSCLAMLRSPVIPWCAAYLWVSVVWYLGSSQSDAAWQEVRYRFLTVINLLPLLFAFSTPAAIRWARGSLVIALIAMIGVNIYETFNPLTFSDIIGRSAGLYVDPNVSAEALVLGMILVVPIIPPSVRAFLIMLTGVGVAVTLSRTGMITWFVATAGLMMSKHVRGKEFVTTLMIAGAAAIVFLIPKIDALLTTWETTGVMNRNVEERMEWFTNPALSDMSSWKRADVALEVWDKFTEHPFVGLGTGASWELEFPSHNQYLSFMLEHGVIGALIVPLLILSTTWGAQGHERPVAMLFAVTVMLISLTSHTMVYRVNSLALFALMAAIAAEHRLREVEGEPPVSEPAAPRPVPAEAW